MVGVVTGMLGVPASQVVLGRSHTCVLTQLGTVYTFGNNQYGQCGRNYIPPSEGKEYIVIHLSNYSSIYPTIHPFTQLFIHLSNYSSIYPTIHPFTQLFIHLSNYSSIYPTVHPFIQLFIHSRSKHWSNRWRCWK